MKKPQIFRQTARTRVVTQINRFIAAVCAAFALCFAFSSQATNILSNPGFDQSPGFSSWTAVTTEGWTPFVYSTYSLSSPNCCGIGGEYGNNGAGNTYIVSEFQQLSSAPGYTYTASAWFSEWVTNGYGEGGLDGVGSGLFANNSATYTAGGSAAYYEDGWVGVQFLSSSNTILADYKSGILNPTLVHNLASSGAVTNYGTTNVALAWFQVPVTNQYNPTTIVVNGDPDPANTTGATLSPGPTNSILSGVMTAPAGTVYVKFSLNVCQSSYSSGAAHWDNCDLEQLTGFAPAAINNLTPNNNAVFNRAYTNFTFNVVSGAGTYVPSNDVQVVENGVDVSKNLQFSGSSNNWAVTLPGLASNSLYAITINVDNSANLASSTSTRFDTFDPNSFVVPAEDYDFNSGQFIQNPTPSTNAGPTTYFGTLGVDGVDYHLYGGGVAGGGQNLIPNYPNRNTNTAWQIPADPQLPNYIAQGAPTSGVYNVTIAYNNAGNWYNYTRNPYPNGGYYQIYARMSYGNGPGGGSETLQLVTSGAGTTNLVTTNIGYFVINAAVPGWNDDWSTYFWVPLGSDPSGLNPTVVNLPAGQQTLQIISGLGCNLSYMAFVPIPALGLPPVIKNFNPPFLTPGQNVFVSTNQLNYQVTSLISSLQTNNIHTYINGVSVPETFTGSSNNWTVSVPLNAIANQPSISVSISAVDNNSLSNGVTGTFDTFSQNNFMIEAGDFDFNGGQWFDNPIETATNSTATNSYYYYPAGNYANNAVYGVDYNTTNVAGATEQYVYRQDGNTPAVYVQAVGTEVTSDFLRSKLINMGPSAVPPFEYVPGEVVPTTNTDCDVGWWPPGTWINYTRTFPSNTYEIYGRLASGGAYSNATMGLVTVGGVTQTTQTLGTFSDANANGFQSWHWVPLMSNGQPAVVTLSGAKTLKVTAPAGSATGSMNAHFYMFVPFTAVTPFSVSASVSAGTVSIKFPTQNGHSYTVYYSTSLDPASWLTLSSGIAGTGGTVTVTDSTTGGAERFYRVGAQ
jgi:hypothetical protein